MDGISLKATQAELSLNLVVDFQEKKGWIGLQTSQPKKPRTEKGQSKQDKHPNCPFTSNKRLSGYMVQKLRCDSCWECHWRNIATQKPHYFIQIASPGQDCNVSNCFHAQAAPAFSQTLGKKQTKLKQVFLYFREQQPLDFSATRWLHSRW